MGERVTVMRERERVCRDAVRLFLELPFSSTSPLFTVSDIPLAGLRVKDDEDDDDGTCIRSSIHLFNTLDCYLHWTVPEPDCKQIDHLHVLHHLRIILPTFNLHFHFAYNRLARARILYSHCASNTTLRLQRDLAALYLIRPIPDNRNPPQQSHHSLW